MISIVNVHPNLIRKSPHNHRKTFHGLDELAVSLREKGMINPVTVRPIPGIHDNYELVAGERRWRASKIAKLSEIPCIVRDLTDKEVLELQLVENVQRADVHPIEEADGYEELIEKHGYEVDTVAAKIGKSKAYVYARLKLCSLAPYPRKAFLEDRLNASVALLIARIADVELQERATRDVLGETEDGPDLTPDLEEDLSDPESPMNWERRTITVKDEDGIKRSESVPMSVREAQIHLQKRYMLRLALAKFAVADTQLVAAAGACTSCEFRTGNQAELFADVASADVCTKPSCFEAKTEAAWKKSAAMAEEQGLKVVESKEASRVFTPSSQVRSTSPYVDPKAPVPLDLLPAGTTKAPTWEKLLGKKLADQAPKVLAQDLSGAGHELLDKAAAVKVLRDAGKIDKPLKPATSSSSSSSSRVTPDSWKEQQAKEEAKRMVWTRAARASLSEAWTNAEDVEADAKWWRWVLTTIAAHLSSDAIVGTDDDIGDLIAKKKIGPEHLLTLILLNDEASVPDNEKQTVWRDPGKEEHLIAGLKLLGIDYEKHLERIKASDKEAAKAEAKIAEKKKPAKKGGKK